MTYKTKVLETMSGSVCLFNVYLMNDETYRIVMAQIDLLNYAVAQLKTGVQLAHELETTGRIEAHDANNHIAEFVRSAHTKIDEIAATCRLAFEYQESES
jgi:hypothetical protein